MSNLAPVPAPAEPQLLIPRKLAQQLVDYLKKQPYELVHTFIDGIVRAPSAVVSEKE